MEPGDQEYQRLFQIFQEECKEHIQKLNEGLLALERSPHEAPLDDILRSAHSLKGASRMMGLKTLETLGHYLETLLTQLSRGEKEAAPPVMEALYRGVDAVSHALTSLEQGKEPEGIDEVIEQIQVAIGERAAAEAAPTKTTAVAPTAKQEPRPAHAATQPQTVRDDGALATIRVKTDKLDTLINLAGELLVSKIEALENLRHIEETLELLEEWRRRLGQDPTQGLLVSRIDALSEELYNILQGLSENTHRLERLVDEIHEGVRDLRLLPVSTILEPFPRMVRDLSRDLGKEAELIIEGASTRLDKKILEDLRDPLIHLVRNSIDHGIESPEERSRKGKSKQGKILIAAKQEGGRVIISVSDDGKGLDRQAIQKTAVEKRIVSAEEISLWRDEEIWELIFRSGFSTALAVTEISGRGVGLDAVLDRVERLKGSMRVESRPGEGLIFTLSLPLTLSTTHALLFQVNSEIFCLPTDVLEKTLLLSSDQITSVQGKSTVVIDGMPLAFSWLADVLNLPKNGKQNGAIPALLLHTQRGKVVLGVETLLGQEEVVVKALGKLLSRVPNLSGGTILGEGQIAFILNPNDLVRSLSQQTGLQTSFVVPSQKSSSTPALPAAKKKVLVVEDSLTTRTLEKNILEAAGFDVTASVDGEDALLQLHEKRFDIVISDVQMPRLDGFSLTERIKSDDRFKEIPVILVTALQTEADKRRGIEAGADAYITKATFDQKHLLDIIRRFI